MLKRQIPTEAIPEAPALPDLLREPIYRLWSEPQLVVHPVTGRLAFVDSRYLLFGRLEGLGAEHERERRLVALAEHFGLKTQGRGWQKRALLLATHLQLPWVVTTWTTDRSIVPRYSIRGRAGRRKELTPDVLMAYLADHFTETDKGAKTDWKVREILTTAEPYKRRWGKRNPNGLKNWKSIALNPQYNTHLVDLHRVGWAEFPAAWDALCRQFSAHMFTAATDPIKAEAIPSPSRRGG